MCVAKLYDINPELVEDQVGFFFHQLVFTDLKLHVKKTSQFFFLQILEP